MEQPEAKPNKRRGWFVMLRNELWQSEAWLSLPSTAMNVYLLILSDAVLARKHDKKNNPNGRDCKRIENSNALKMTYTQAEKKLHRSSRAIADAIQMLVDKGLIDRTREGAGLYKVETLYGLSERWRRYGKPDFQAAPERPVRSSAGSEGLRRFNQKRTDTRKRQQQSQKTKQQTLQNDRIGNGKSSKVNTAEMVESKRAEASFSG
ncbi:hypothetical protein LLH00_18375 [bacterium]|nr:hypothetical protein [bacterium]